MAHADHREADAEAILGDPSPIRSALRNWFTLVSKAEWASPADVKTMFGATVDFLGDNRLIFDISGNRYRLTVHVACPFRRVLIKFVGTHKDYDKIDPETV